MLDLIIRLLIKLSIVKPTSDIRYIYIKSKKMQRLRNIISIPIIGYYDIEVLCKKE